MCKSFWLNGLGYVNKQLYLTPLFFKDKPLKRLFGRDIETYQKYCVWDIIANKYHSSTPNSNFETNIWFNSYLLDLIKGFIFQVLCNLSVTIKRATFKISIDWKKPPFFNLCFSSERSDNPARRKSIYGKRTYWNP